MEFLTNIWKFFRKHKQAYIGAVIVTLFILMAVLAPFVTPHSPTEGDITQRLKSPAWMKGGSWDHPLGTDNLGRDLLSRIIYGSRVSISIGLIVILISTALGILLGLISGFQGGIIDTFTQRVVDILLAFPYLVFALAIMAVTGPGFFNIVLALVYKEWVTPCRVIRGDVLASKEEDFIEAAKAMGASSLRIMVKDLLPNVLSSVIVVSTLRVAWVIIMEASLSFLGLGIQPPTPSWGGIISSGRDYVFVAWWISTFPGLAILLLVLGINLFGQGLRDALDPRMSETGI